MLQGCELTLSPLSALPLNPHPSVSGSLLAVGLPNVLKFSGVETSANGLWSPNGLYLFMQALASPQDSVALTQEDSRASEKKWPFIRVTQHFKPMSRQMATSGERGAHFCWWRKWALLQNLVTFSFLCQSPFSLACRLSWCPNYHATWRGDGVTQILSGEEKKKSSGSRTWHDGVWKRKWLISCLPLYLFVSKWSFSLMLLNDSLLLGCALPYYYLLDVLP